MPTSHAYPRRIGLAAVFLLALVNGIFLRRWVIEDTRPAAWDQAIHTKVAYIYKDRLANEGWGSVLRPAYFNYPPLYHLSLVPVLSYVDDVADAGALANFFYLGMLLFSIYLIGALLMGPWQGFTAAFLFSCYPLVFDMATQTMTDLALTAWVAVSLLCLLKSEHFSKIVWSVGFGLSVGLAMLTKWSAGVYICGPFLYSLMLAARSRKLRWLVVSLLIASAVALPWYISNLAPMLARIAHVSSLPTSSGYGLKGAANALWYPLSLFEQMGFVSVLFLIPGFAALFWRPKLKPLVLWFLTSLVLFTLLHNRNTRYFLPALPAAALLSVAWLPSARKVPFVAMNLIIAFLFFTFHFNPEKSFFLKSGPFPIPVLKDNRPYSVDWKHGPIIDKIRELKNPSEKIARVLVVSNAAHFHSTTLDLTLRHRNIDDIAFRGPSKQRWFEFADFLLLKTGDLGPAFTIKTVQECSDVITHPPDWFSQVFREAGRWPLPDGSQAVLFAQSLRPSGTLDVGTFGLTLDHMELPNIAASGVSIRAVPKSKAATSLGVFKELVIEIKKGSYKTFDFEDVKIDLVHPQINLPLFLETQDLQLLKLETLRPRAAISTESLLRYVAQKAKWLKNPQVLFEGQKISISGRAGGLPVDLSVMIWAEGGALHTRFERLVLTGIPVPRFVAAPLLDKKIPLRANRDMPYNLEINSIKGENGKLRIN